jgi:hypothetical protein
MMMLTHDINNTLKHDEIYFDLVVLLLIDLFVFLLGLRKDHIMRCILVEQILGSRVFI